MTNHDKCESFKSASDRITYDRGWGWAKERNLARKPEGLLAFAEGDKK